MVLKIKIPSNTIKSTLVKKYKTLNINTQMISRKFDSSPTLVYAPDRYCKQNSHQTLIPYQYQKNVKSSL